MGHQLVHQLADWKVASLAEQKAELMDDYWAD
jgi:hypothetical protein